MPLGLLERVMGIEPTFLAWEANVLPLNYTRLAFTEYNIPDAMSKPQATLLKLG